jgi:hypothetical protein
VITFIEIIAVIAICIGFWHEDKVIAWEDKIINQLLRSGRQ